MAAPIVPGNGGEGAAMTPSLSDPAGPSLTERDEVLLRCLGAGDSTAQIAAALSVSGNTARTRIRRVQRKLGVSTRGQLASAGRALDLR
jgi:DNA-binding CsgD family transcriptional regulator